MEAGKVYLTYKCPVKWNSMSVSREGKFCSSCNKVVKDFTNAKPSEIGCASEKFECGSFYATQLDKPFNDKRDVLISYYQKVKSGSSSRKIMIMFVTVLLFITGCRSRRLGGAYVYDAPTEKKTKQIETIEKQKVPI